jgi:MFS family permease
MDNRVGTLNYTRRSLAWLFFWLLLGDFCATQMETALPKLLPLQLDAYGFGAGSIAWMLSLGPLAAMVLSPFIGVWSDRLRTRWGRRRPFLFVSTPVMAVGLLLIPHIRNYVLLVCVIMVVQVANVLQTVLFYLYADVVPARLMGRFMGAFRFVGAFGTLSFQWFLFPHFDTNPTMVWSICALVYFVFFQIMIHCIREGDYPDPSMESAREITKDYIKEGFGSRYIWMLWLTLGTVALAVGGGTFVDLFSKNNLHLGIPEIARMNAYATVATIVLSLPAGWLVDRIGPKPVWGGAGFLLGVISAAAFLLIHDAAAMRWFYMASAGLNAVLGAALMPMLYAHLPRDRFGQLTSTQSLVMQGFIFLSINGSGHLIAVYGNNYRLGFLISGLFLCLTPLFLFLLYRSRSPFAGQAMAMHSKPSDFEPRSVAADSSI